MSGEENASDAAVVIREAFVASVCTALQEMSSVEADVRLVAPENLSELSGEWICASIELVRRQAGVLRIWLDELTAGQLASRYLGENVELSPAMVDDFAGELVNVVAGQAKTMLKGTEHHFQMALPQVRRTTDHGPVPFLAEIRSAVGRLWIELVGQPH